MAKNFKKDEIKVEELNEVKVEETVAEVSSEKVAYIKGYDQYGNPSWGFK